MADSQNKSAGELKEAQRLHNLAFEQQETDFITELTALTEKHRLEIAKNDNRFAEDLLENERLHAVALEK